MASPSLSRSVAKYICSAPFAAFLRDLITFSFSGIICQSAVHPLSGSIPILLISLFLSLTAFNFCFSSGEIFFGIEALLAKGDAFLGRSLIWPTLDSTI